MRFSAGAGEDASVHVAVAAYVELENQTMLEDVPLFCAWRRRYARMVSVSCARFRQVAVGVAHSVGRSQWVDGGIPDAADLFCEV